MKLPRRQIASIFYFSAVALVAVLVLSALPQHAAPQAPAGGLVFALDPAQSKVHWTLGTTLHTVHGTFALKKGALQLDLSTGKATGEIVADATSCKTDNDSRDKKMHKDVLESARFTDIIFRPDRIDGKVASQGESAVQLHGVFLLHGAEHEFTVPVHANLAAGHWSATANFSIPFIDWGLKNPSNWLLKVDHAVTVDLDLKGTIRNPASQ
jgi:polyisoprenoid-binding protein YceI